MQSNHYKANFILDMRYYTEPLEVLIEKICHVIADFGALVGEVTSDGQKNFERSVDRNFTSGIYLEVAFLGDSSLPKAIREKFQLDKAIDRILIERHR
jgi:ribosomal protein S6